MWDARNFRSIFHSHKGCIQRLHIMTKTANTSSVPRRIVSLPCACASLRRASRIVTQLYDEELRRTGMRATQFTLLQALATAKNITQGDLADLLGMDSTTLTRTLTPLRKKGWIGSERGEDRRQVRLTLTAKGAREFRRAEPYWASAQQRLRKALGDANWSGMVTAAERTAELARA
jgi:DNA-binding MarR family transcriptional regulator